MHTYRWIMMTANIAPYVIIQMATLRYLLVFVVLLIAGTIAQEATETVQATVPAIQEVPAPPAPTQTTPTEHAPATNTVNEAASPTPQPADTPSPTPAPTEHAIEASATSPESYLEKIKKIREEVAKSSNLDHKYLEQKIQEVIGSMTPEQKDTFEQQLSSEARAAYEKYKKSLDEQAQKSQQQTEQLIQETKVSESQAKLNQQRQAMKADGSKYYGQGYNDYQFQIQSQSSEDLQFTLPIDQSVHFFMKVFTNTNGVYGTVTNIDDEQPIRVFVYQNRDKIVAQISGYSSGSFGFQGKANSTYLVRLSNQGSSRLIFLTMSHILLDAHIGTKLTVEDMADHTTRVLQIRDELLFRMGEQREKLMLQSENEKSLLKGFDHYYFYSVGEIILLGIICVIQVESIRKLLINSSVV